MRITAEIATMKIMTTKTAIAKTKTAIAITTNNHTAATVDRIVTTTDMMDMTADMIAIDTPSTATIVIKIATIVIKIATIVIKIATTVTKIATIVTKIATIVIKIEVGKARTAATKNAFRGVTKITPVIDKAPTREGEKTSVCGERMSVRGTNEKEAHALTKPHPSERRSNGAIDPGHQTVKSADHHRHALGNSQTQQTTSA